eukprot:6726484-Pyramimonas_sp.AAC.1
MAPLTRLVFFVGEPALSSGRAIPATTTSRLHSDTVALRTEMLPPGVLQAALEAPVDSPLYPCG